tara:strand:+ start:3656 stop:4774 length:1119 start_codon:yes stop_codon:yes gene_type:complete
MARVDNQGGSGFTVDNGTGLQVRTKLQQTIDALRSLQSGSGDPTVGVSAYQLHVDEVSNTSQILKIRNKANNDFITIGDVAQTNLGLLPLSGGTLTGVLTLSAGTTSAPSINFGDSNTGFYRLGAGSIGITAGGTFLGHFTQDAINIFGQKELRLFHQSLINAKYLGFKAPQTLSNNVTFTLPDGDGSAGQFLKTDGSGNLSFSTISSAASALTGSTLASGVTASSLTSVGTLTALTVSGDSKLTTIKDTSGNNPSTPAEVAQGRAKVWLNFDGTATTNATDLAGVRDSFNVSSVVETASGELTVNFTNAMSNTNYCVSTTGTQELDSVSLPDLVIAHSYTTTSVKLETFRNGSTQTEQDLAIVCLVIFGDQ